MVGLEAKPFPKLTLKMLMNWPRIAVHVNILDATFTRRNLHDYKRYLSSTMEYSSDPPTDDSIFYVKKVEGTEGDISVFSYTYVRTYFLELLNSISAKVKDSWSER